MYSFISFIRKEIVTQKYVIVKEYNKAVHLGSVFIQEDDKTTGN